MTKYAFDNHFHRVTEQRVDIILAPGLAALVWRLDVFSYSVDKGKVRCLNFYTNEWIRRSINSTSCTATILVESVYKDLYKGQIVYFSLTADKKTYLENAAWLL